MSSRIALLVATVLLPVAGALTLGGNPAQAYPASLASGATIAQAGPGGPGGGQQEESAGMDARRLSKMKQELGLSDAQVQQMQTIHTNAKTQSQGLRDQMKAAQDQMKQMMASGATDAQLRLQHQKIQGLKTQLDSQRFDTQLAIRNVLTPAQQTKMAQMMGERRQEREGQGQGPRGGRRGAGQAAVR
jgi:periplasmic protein CpxP/Spy